MAAVRLDSPISSESSSSFHPSPYSSRHVMNLSFRRPVEDSTSSSDDEFELSLPEDDDSQSEQSPVITNPRRKPTYYRRSSSVWSSDRLLTIEENTRQEAASALLRLRQSQPTTSTSFQSEFANNLSHIFALANLRLEDAQKRPSSNEQSPALQLSLQTRQQEFEKDAESSIAQFLAEQKRILAEEEAAAKKAQEELEQAARAEAESIAKQKLALQAAEEAKRKQEQESALERERAAAVENDFSTLWPAQQLKSIESLQRFCNNRAQMFNALDEQVKAAPFSPDRQLFLECNEVLNRFSPTAESVPSTVKEIMSVLSKAGGDRLDIHLCSLSISFLKQVQNKVFQNPSYALGFARLWKALGSAIPRSAIVIMAAFFARCPPAAINLDPPGQEHTSAQSGSLRALLRVFCCFIQRSDEQASSFAWCWLSSVCSLPVTVLSAPSLLMFLEVSQILKFKFFTKYGQQGRKLILYFANNVVPRIPDANGALSSDMENLKTFFDLASLRKIPERSFILACLQNV